MLGVLNQKKKQLADPNLTLALLNFQGANGSTTFTDSSPHSANRVISHSGTAQISNEGAEASFGNRLSVFGSSSVSIQDISVGQTDFDFGTGAFTIDGRVEIPNTTSMYYNSIFQDDVSPPPSSNISLFFDGSNNFYFWANPSDGNAFSIIHQTPFAFDTKYHFAVVRNGVYVDLYINGVRATTRANIAANAAINTTGTIYLSNANGANTLNGYIDEFRIRKEAVYTGASFTVPTAPFAY